MIWKPVQTYIDFTVVMAMPAGTRRRRSIWRLERVSPALYAEFNQRYREQVKEPKKGKRSR